MRRYVQKAAHKHTDRIVEFTLDRRCDTSVHIEDTSLQSFIHFCYRNNLFSEEVL